jgi:hypothetical protein
MVLRLHAIKMHAYLWKLLSSVWKPHSASKNTLCVWKSYFACRNQSCACWNYTRACCNHIRTCRNHTREDHNHTHTCQNHTLRVEIILLHAEITVVSVEITIMRVKITMRVEIILCMHKLHTRVSLSHSWESYLYVYVSKLLSCEWKPHSASKITLCV